MFMNTSFKELNPAKSKSFLKKLETNSIPHHFKEKSKFLMQDLSFSDEWVRIDAEDYSETPFIKKSFFLKENVIKPFQFTDHPLNDNLKDISPKICEKTVIDYLLLYCHLWIQNGEVIKPALNFEDIPWQDDVSPMIKKSLDQDFGAYPKISKNNNALMVTIICLFKQSLMTVTFDVEENGGVTVTDRVVLIEDLPIKHLP
ncbi:MAG: hypothetical protein COB76_04890 [Alphaproteobacteria bacterium]|nr:MAG: hypothetical protein COB76_04890 [Alphaproteobacteria bacterium]